MKIIIPEDDSKVYESKEELLRLGITGLKNKVTNGYYSNNCRDCYECIDCQDCIYCTNCIGCFSCTNCHNCYECENCKDCLFSDNLRDNQYVIKNIQLTQEEYEEFLSK